MRAAPTAPRPRRTSKKSNNPSAANSRTERRPLDDRQQAFVQGIVDGARREERQALHERLERFHHAVSNAHALGVASEVMAGAAREPGAMRRAHTLMGLLLGELDMLVGAIGELDAGVRS